jgi:hypothetical protein
MRSGTFLQPGETTGCVGCHEERLSAVPNATRSAWMRPPDEPRSWFGAPRDFNYLTEVQPVFDRHCVSCHDHGKEAGQALNLAGDLGLLFNTSYLELHRRSAVRWQPDKPGEKKLLVKAVHDGPPAVLPPYAWGSHRSRLVEVLAGEHHDVKVSQEDFERVVTWIDLNAPYYGSYTSIYPENAFGRSPLDDVLLERLCDLVDREVDELKHDPELQLSFTRPRLSPILGQFDGPTDPRYGEALAIIEAGKNQLARQPREDTLGPDARPRIARDTRRHEIHLARQQAEAAARRAVVEGRKVYAGRPGE